MNKLEKNYYEILEVDKNASPEIIEKSYKTLVKKYHPDLQENNLKNIYEEKIKKINEAYDILSDLEKRKNYDLNLKNTEISPEEFNNLINENNNLKKEINYLKNNINSIQNNYHMNTNSNDNIYNQEHMNENSHDNYYNQEHMNKNSHDNYYNHEHMNKNSYVNNTNYSNNNYKKIKLNNYLKNLSKNLFAFFCTILIMGLFLFILWQIPFIKNYIKNLYNDNFILQYFINIFKNLFN